jgi:hypothetical protein
MKMRLATYKINLTKEYQQLNNVVGLDYNLSGGCNKS